MNTCSCFPAIQNGKRPILQGCTSQPIALASLPLISADISPLIPHLNSNATLSHPQSLSYTNQPPNSFEPYELESSSFISTQTNARTEVEETRQLLHIQNIPLAPSIDWTPISISPINEYNT